MVKANWSGSYPCLCSGTWTLEVNGVDVSSLIPEELRHDEMNTYGSYQSWHFNNDYIEEFESYSDGLMCNKWIEKNKYWLNTITENVNVQKEIYHAINEHDWRHGSCGGCI